SVYDELEELQEAMHGKRSVAPAAQSGVDNDSLEALTAALADLQKYLEEDGGGSAEAMAAIETAKHNLTGLAASVQTLATSADESSSSVLEMSATTDEVAENIGELATSVREMVASIEEMAFSIREVATNVDELSL